MNRLVDLDPESKSRLQAIEGRVLQFHIKGLDLDVFILIHADELELMSSFDGEIDTVISAYPGSMIAMTQSNQGLFGGDVDISGDVETGKKFKRYLDTLEIDWEEQLSQMVGDSAAYQIGQLVRKWQTYSRNTAGSLRQNIAEFLTEEAQLSAPKSEISHFTEDVDQLRSDFDRLDVRISMLEKKRETSG